MKFLMMGKSIAFPGITPTPPDAMHALNLAARDYVKERLDDGTVECHYVFPDGGGFVIANADSHEQAMEILLGYPLYPMFAWEVKGLCDWEYSYDKFTELWGAAAG